MALIDSLPVYSAILATLGILIASLKYILSSKIGPIEKDIEVTNKDIEKIEEEYEEFKKSLVNDLRDISNKNFEFRLRNDKIISDLRLLLAEKYISKEEFEKDIKEIKYNIRINNEIGDINSEIKNIRHLIESANTRETNENNDTRSRS